MEPATTTNTEQGSTASNNAKCVRFNTSPTSVPTTPMEKAKSVVKIALLSLPTAMQPLAEKEASEFLKLRVELQRFQDIKKKQSAPDYTPKSGLIKFTVNASNRVKETVPDKLTELEIQAKMAREAFMAAAKTVVQAAVDLEIAVVKAEIRKKICLAFELFAHAVCLSLPNVANIAAHRLVLSSLKHQQKVIQLLRHSCFNPPFSVGRFWPHFLEATTNSTVPNDGHVANTDLYSAEMRTTVEPALPMFVGLLEACFGKSWDDYETTKINLKRNLDLESFVQAQLTERATVDTAMALSDTEAAQKAKVEDLIASQLTVHMKPMKKQLDALSQQLKNANRGAQPSTPSTKKQGKKQPPPDSKTTNARTRKTATVAAAAAQITPHPTTILEKAEKRAKKPPGTNKSRKNNKATANKAKPSRRPSTAS